MNDTTEVNDNARPDETESNINDGEGLEIADPNDFIIRRGADDELQPVVQKIPGRDKAMRVIPPTTGNYNKYHLEEPEELYADDELYAEFLNEHFPDLEEVTAEDVEQGLIAYGAEVFVDLAKRAGGQDMKDAMDERQIQRMMEYLNDGEGNVDFQQLVQMGQEMENEDSEGEAQVQGLGGE